jgi:hypothetical protein
MGDGRWEMGDVKISLKLSKVKLDNYEFSQMSLAHIHIPLQV